MMAAAAALEGAGSPTKELNMPPVVQPRRGASAGTNPTLLHDSALRTATNNAAASTPIIPTSVEASLHSPISTPTGTKLAVTTPSKSPAGGEGARITLDEEKKIALSQLQELEVAIKVRKVTKVDGRKIRWIEHRARMQAEEAKQGTLNKKRTRRSKSKSNGGENSENDANVVNNNNNNSKSDSTMKVDTASTPLSVVGTNNVLESMKQQFLQGTESIDEPLTNGKTSISETTVTIQKRKSGRTRRSVNTPEGTNPKNSTSKRLSPTESKGTQPQSGNETKNNASANSSIIDTSLSMPNTPTTPITSDPAIAVALKKKFFAPKSLTKGLREVRKVENGVEGEISSKSEDVSTPASSPIPTSVASLSIAALTPAITGEMNTETKTSEAKSSESKTSETKTSCPLVRAAAKLLSPPSVRSRSADNTSAKGKKVGAQKGGNKKVGGKASGRSESEPRNVMNGHTETLQNGTAEEKGPSPATLPTNERVTPNRNRMSKENSPASTVSVESPMKRPRGRPPKRGPGVNKDSSTTAAGKSSKKLATVVVDVHNTMNGEPQTVIPVSRPVLRGKRASPTKKKPQKAAPVLPEDTDSPNIKQLSPSPKRQKSHEEKRPNSHEDVKSKVGKDQKDLLQIVSVQNTKKRKTVTGKKHGVGKKYKESIRENKEGNEKSSASTCNQTPVSPDKTLSTKLVKGVPKPVHQEVPSLSELENPTAILPSLTPNKEQKGSKPSPKVKPLQARRKETSQDLAKIVTEKNNQTSVISKDAEGTPAQKSNAVQRCISAQKGKLVPKAVSADRQIPAQKMNLSPKLNSTDTTVTKVSSAENTETVMESSSQKGDTLENVNPTEKDKLILEKSSNLKTDSTVEDITVLEIIPTPETDSSEKDVPVTTTLPEACSLENDTSTEASSVLSKAELPEKITPPPQASSSIAKAKPTEKDTHLLGINTLVKASFSKLDNSIQKNITFPKVNSTHKNIPAQESSTLPKICSSEKEKNAQLVKDKCVQKESLLPNNNSTNNNELSQKDSPVLKESHEGKGIPPVRESQTQKIIEESQIGKSIPLKRDSPVPKLIVAQNNNLLQNEDKALESSSHQRELSFNKSSTTKRENKVLTSQRESPVQKSSLVQQDLMVRKVTPAKEGNSPRIPGPTQNQTSSQKGRTDQNKSEVHKDKQLQRPSPAEKDGVPEIGGLVHCDRLTAKDGSGPAIVLPQKESSGHKDYPAKKSSPKIKAVLTHTDSVTQTDSHISVKTSVEVCAEVKDIDEKINETKPKCDGVNSCSIEKNENIVQKDISVEGTISQGVVFVNETSKLERDVGTSEKAEVEFVKQVQKMDITRKENDEQTSESQEVGQAQKGKGKRQVGQIPRDTTEQENQKTVAVKGGTAVVQNSKENLEIQHDTNTQTTIEKPEEAENKEAVKAAKAPEISQVQDKSTTEITEVKETVKTSTQSEVAVLQRGETEAEQSSTSASITEVPVSAVAKSKEKVPRILKQLFQDEGVQNMLKSMGEESGSVPETSPNNDPGAHKLRPKRVTEPMLSSSPELDAMEALLTSATRKKKRGTELDTLYMDEGVLNLLTSLEPHSRRSHQDDAASDTSQASSSRSVKGIKSSKSSLEVNSESRKRKLSGASTVSNSSTRSMQPPESKRARLEGQDLSEDPYELAAAEEFQELPVSVDLVPPDVDVNQAKKKGKPTLPLSVRQKNKAIRIQLKLQKQKQMKVLGSDSIQHKEDDNMNLAELKEVLRKAKETFNETPLIATPVEKEPDRSVPPLKIRLASDSVTIKPVSRPNPVQQVATVDVGKQARLPARQNISDISSRPISRPTPILQEPRVAARGTVERPRPYPERRTPPPQLRRFDSMSSPAPSSFSSLVRTFDGTSQQRTRQRIGGESVRQSQRASVRQSEGSYHYRDISLRKFNNFTQIILSPSTTKMKNALNSRVLRELCEALNILKRDESVRIVLLTATGSTFCQGVDLTALQHHNIETRKKNAENLVRGIKDFLKALVQFPKPIVAGVNGNAMGLGVTMLPLFDVVIANDKAEFYLPYAKLGQVPEGGATYTFPNLFGKLQATKLFLGHKITASKAQEMGLASESIWPATYQQELIPKVALLATQSAQSMEATKALMNHHLVTKLELSLESECRLLLQQWTSPHFIHLCKRFLDSHHIHLQKPVNLPL